VALRKAIMLDNTFNAIRMGMHTLVGALGSPPYTHGNCFSVYGDDEKEYKIVNFIYENLEHLGEKGLKWPISCLRLGERTAVIHDPRIGERWYKQTFCEVCTPYNLLPVPQILVHKRDILRERRIEHDNNGFRSVTYMMNVPSVEFE
jgi:hypothetical protein